MLHEQYNSGVLCLSRYQIAKKKKKKHKSLGKKEDDCITNQLNNFFNDSLDCYSILGANQRKR